MVEEVTSDLCATCHQREPLNGYVCECCIHDELNRIRNLPPNQVREALDDLDRKQLGYARSPQERLDYAEEMFRQLCDSWGFPHPDD